MPSDQGTGPEGAGQERNQRAMFLLDGLLRRVVGRADGGTADDKDGGGPGATAAKTRDDAFWGDQDAGDDQSVMLDSFEELEQLLKGAMRVGDVSESTEDFLDRLSEKTGGFKLGQLAEALEDAELEYLRRETEGAGQGDRETPAQAELGDNGDQEAGSLDADANGGGQGQSHGTEEEPEVDFFNQEIGSGEPRRAGGEAIEERLLDSASVLNLPDQATGHDKSHDQATGHDKSPDQATGHGILPDQGSDEESPASTGSAPESGDGAIADDWSGETPTTEERRVDVA